MYLASCGVHRARRAKRRFRRTELRQGPISWAEGPTRARLTRCAWRSIVAREGLAVFRPARSSCAKDECERSDSVGVRREDRKGHWEQNVRRSERTVKENAKKNRESSVDGCASSASSLQNKAIIEGDILCIFAPRCGQIVSTIEIHCNTSVHARLCSP